LCTPQRRASRRARQRALERTNTDIESIQKRTTDEAIVRVDEFAVRVYANIPEGYGTWPLKDVGTALNCAMRILLTTPFPGRPGDNHRLPNSFGLQHPFSCLT
jgi:hypothetical protein